MCQRGPPAAPSSSAPSRSGAFGPTLVGRGEDDERNRSLASQDVRGPRTLGGQAMGTIPPGYRRVRHARTEKREAPQGRTRDELQTRVDSAAALLRELAPVGPQPGFLFEDAMLTNPGFQLFARDGGGFCFGSPLKKVQWILSIIITQVQIMLHPDENMKGFTSAADSTTYPGQDFKLRHMQYVFDDFLPVSKNVLASRVGMYNDSEEALGSLSRPSDTTPRPGFQQTAPHPDVGIVREAQQ